MNGRNEFVRDRDTMTGTETNQASIVTFGKPFIHPRMMKSKLCSILINQEIT